MSLVVLPLRAALLKEKETGIRSLRDGIIVEAIPNIRKETATLRTLRSHPCPLWGVTVAKYCVQTPFDQHRIRED